jgi:hypothetical protein
MAPTAPRADDGPLAQTLAEIAALGAVKPRRGSREVGARLADTLMSKGKDQFRGNVQCGRCGWPIGFLHASTSHAPDVIAEFLVPRGWFWDEQEQCLVAGHYLRWLARFPARAPYGQDREASREAFIALPAPGASWRVGDPPAEPFFAKCPKCANLRVKISLPQLWAESLSPQAARKLNSARLVGKSNDGWKVGT